MRLTTARHWHSWHRRASLRCLGLRHRWVWIDGARGAHGASGIGPVGHDRDRRDLVRHLAGNLRDEVDTLQAFAAATVVHAGNQVRGSKRIHARLDCAIMFYMASW